MSGGGAPSQFTSAGIGSKATVPGGTGLPPGGAFCMLEPAPMPGGAFWMLGAGPMPGGGR